MRVGAVVPKCLGTLALALHAAAGAAAAPGHAEGIHWFGGPVEQAFSVAQAQHKPVLLYWGASWCPPCHQLSLTVFTRRDFIAKSRLFVPVHLDGDLPGAQKWGEQFRVTGYPTLLVLDSGRHELMRIAGGMDLNRYAEVLDLALADLQPADQLLAAAATRSLRVTECRRLAFNAWALEEIDDAALGDFAAGLAAAARRCGADADAAVRLTLTAAYFATQAESAALEQGEPPSARMSGQVDAVRALLDRPAQARAAADALYYLRGSFFLAVKARGAVPAEQFEQRFAAIAGPASSDAHFAVPDQLNVIATWLSMQKTLHGAPDAALLASARERIAHELAATHLAYARSPLINSILHIYDVLGDNQSAYALVKAEIPRAAAPYYFKADLAGICEDLGRKEEALHYAAEAYDEARGIATRFQWGYEYLTALTRMRPDDVGTIGHVGGQVLAELSGGDRIYRRARFRLEKLDHTLRAWRAGSPQQRGPVLASLRQQMQGICAGIPAGEAGARGYCQAFLGDGV